jgi:hypothetical protein
MKIYLVERTDKVGWDEFDAFVVRADNEEDAIKQCDYWFAQEPNVVEVTPDGPKGRILGSFCAG